MKKVNYIWAILFAVCAGFVSCEKDEEIDPPTITVNLNGTDQTSITVVQGETVTYRIDIEAVGEIEKIDLKLKNGSNLSGFPITKDFTTKTKHQLTGTFPTSTTGKAEFILDVFDKKGNSTNRSIEVTVEASTNPNPTEISTFTNVEIKCNLGDGSAKSSAASADGTTFTPASATAAQQAKADFVFHRTANTGTIYAPSSVTATAGSSVFANWTTKRTTYFKAITTPAFENITADNIVASVGTEGLTATSVDVVNGTVVAFKTADNKVGVFKVTAISSGAGVAADFVKIDIKVVK
ncbi:MAG: DUF4625 domain-containing protein [Bacteroidales bacterium]|jgi:hypothetical protein|nr:DUF4625 domain-containing protein [Bacteroidales bacterium]